MPTFLRQPWPVPLHPPFLRGVGCSLLCAAVGLGSGAPAAPQQCPWAEQGRVQESGAVILGEPIGLLGGGRTHSEILLSLSVLFCS